MAAIAQLKAVLGMDSKEFKAGMKSATKDTSTFQSQIASVGKMLAGAFSVGAIISFSKSIITWASDISEAAQNAGVLTSEMMALNQVALQGGLNVDEMRRMLSVLQIEVGKAADGEEEARKKFDGLNVSIEELAAMDPASQLQAIAKAAFDTADPMGKLAEIFSTKLGPKSISAMRDLAENALPAVNQAAADAADAAEALGDRWALYMDKAKAKTLELTMAVIDGARAAMAYAKGATAGMSATEKMVRLSLAVVTGGISLIPGKKNRAAGITALTELQTSDAAGYGANAERRKEQQRQSQIAMYEKALRSKVRLGKEALDKFDKDELEKENKYNTQEAKRKSEVEKARDLLFKKRDTREQHGERTDRINEQIESLKVGNGTGGTMTPDAYARIGGFFGGERPGYDVASRQLDTLKKIEALEREKVKNDKEFYESMERLNGGGL